MKVKKGKHGLHLLAMESLSKEALIWDTYLAHTNDSTRAATQFLAEFSTQNCTLQKQEGN